MMLSTDIEDTALIDLDLRISVFTQHPQTGEGEAALLGDAPTTGMTLASTIAAGTNRKSGTTFSWSIAPTIYLPTEPWHSPPSV